ncbi:hypothetical protein [Sphingobacterium sp.]|uniref:hypothetical protein n=1 Tax=Sphingobacterium sp. TaxID=341027 RepID=UPI0031E30BC3
MKFLNNYLACLLTLLLSGLCIFQASAQMAAATRVKYDIDRSTSVSLSAFKVWQLLLDDGQISRISDGYITASLSEDKKTPVHRVVTFSTGKPRKEIVSQIEHDKYLLVYTVSKSSLKEIPLYIGIDEIQFVVTVKDKDDKTTINWKVKVLGNESAKNSALEQLNQEISHYENGFKKIDLQ